MMNYIHAFREYVAPLSEKSNFFSSGVLTAQEFVEAGDFLVYKCPTWKWSAGDPTKRRSYLPNDKQYLVTRNVPCTHRCKEGKEYYPEHHEGEWTIYEDPAEREANEPIDLDDHGQAMTPKNDATEQDAAEQDEVNVAADNDEANDTNDANDVPDDAKDADNEIDEDEYYDAEKDDVLTGCSSNNILKSRTYDVYITWDKWFETPRVWLFGYDENKVPLTNEEMFEDVSPEHAQKTVTYEYHPHENYMALSIHPCKHASVMKKLISQRMEGEKKMPIRVDQYLCIFLKFIGTVIPTISYDYSLAL